MKQFILAFILLISAGKGFCQDGDNIVGTWKVVSISDSRVYYHIKKDSLIIKSLPESNGNQNDQSAVDTVQNSLKKFMKEFFGKISLEFKKNKTYKFEGDFGGMFEGNYEIDAVNKIIKLKETNKIDEGKEDAFKYAIKDEKLILFINDENESMFELKKEKSN